MSRSGLLRLETRCPRCRSRTGVEIPPEVRAEARALPPEQVLQIQRCAVCRLRLSLTAADFAAATL